MTSEQILKDLHEYLDEKVGVLEDLLECQSTESTRAANLGRKLLCKEILSFIDERTELKE